MAFKWPTTPPLPPDSAIAFPCTSCPILHVITTNHLSQPVWSNRANLNENARPFCEECARIIDLHTPTIINAYAEYRFKILNTAINEPC